MNGCKGGVKKGVVYEVQLFMSGRRKGETDQGTDSW